MILTKKAALFDRDEKGDVIAQKISLAYLDKSIDEGFEIIATPLLRGEVKRVFSAAVNGETEKDQDFDIIKEHCIEPKFTDDEIRTMKKYMVDAIVNAILDLSGLKPKQKASEDYEINLDDDIKKNSTMIEKEA